MTIFRLLCYIFLWWNGQLTIQNIPYQKYAPNKKTQNAHNCGCKQKANKNCFLNLTFIRQVFNKCQFHTHVNGIIQNRIASRKLKYAQNCGCNATFCIFRFNAFKHISYTSLGIYMCLWLSDALKYLFEEDGTHKMLKSAQMWFAMQLRGSFCNHNCVHLT